jgi:ribose 5-phosphate isomerase
LLDRTVNEALQTPGKLNHIYLRGNLTGLGKGSTVRYANLDVETLASATNDALSATALERSEAISRTMDNNGAAIAAMRLAENHG